MKENGLREILREFKVDKYKMPEGLVAYYETDIDQAASQIKAHILKEFSEEYIINLLTPSKDSLYFVNKQMMIEAIAKAIHQALKEKIKG